MSTQKSIWSKMFILIMVVNAFASVASYMTNPIMPQCLLEKGIAFELTGVLSSILSWVSLSFRPFSGWASDNFNKKKVMAASYGLSALCMFGYMMSPSFEWIVITRVLHGIAFAFSATLSLTFATTFIPKENLAEGLAYLSLGQLVGSMFGPQLGASICDMKSVSSVFFVAGLLFIVSFVISVFLPYKPEKRDHKKLSIKFNNLISPTILPYMFLICIFSIGNSVISYYLKTMGEERHIANIAIFFTVNSLVMLVAKPLTSKVQDKHGIHWILYPSYIISTISMVILAKAYSLTLVIISSVLKALGQGCGSPAIQAESVKLLGTENSGVAVSTCLIGQDIGNAIGPIIGSSLIISQGYEMTYMYLAALTFSGLIFFAIYYKIKYKKKEGLV